MSDPNLGRIADLIEHQLVPALGRIAAALERLPALGNAGDAASDGRNAAVAEARQAIDAGQWKDAERLVRDFGRDFPEARERPGLEAELAEGREAAVAGLRAELDAARGVNDHDRAITLRDGLAEHLRGERLDALDRELVRWLMGLVRKGLAEVPLRLDVVQLATRVSDTFAATAEGASLRRALPVLRRAVGLCPRCARPYAGEDDVCPDCQAAFLAELPPAPGDELADHPRPSLLEEAGLDEGGEPGTEDGNAE